MTSTQGFNSALNIESNIEDKRLRFEDTAFHVIARRRRSVRKPKQSSFFDILKILPGLPRSLAFARNDKKTYGNSRKAAFTLAEVLITLGIIGVIAALILPGIIEDVRKKIYVAQLKKAYSVSSQAFQKMCADSGNVPLIYSEFAELGVLPGLQREALDNYYRKYFNITKSCTVGSCTPPEIKSSKKDKYDSMYSGYTTLGGISSELAVDLYYLSDLPVKDIFITADGMIFYVHRYLHVSDFKVWDFYVDVNGVKGPNIIGRDVFQLYVGSDCTVGAVGDERYAKLEVDNWKTHHFLCGEPNIKDVKKFSQVDDHWIFGKGCAARIIENGWVMDY